MSRDFRSPMRRVPMIRAMLDATILIRHPVRTAVDAVQMLWWWRLHEYPWQSYREMRLMKTVLARIGEGHLRVFEWGTGTSTIYYAKYLRSIGRSFEWHSVDHSRVWHERIQRRVHEEGLDGSVHLYYPEFPDPMPLNWTCDNPDAPPSVEYIECPKALGRFDVLFVDGKFRAHCLRRARDFVKPDGVVMQHDAPYRPEEFRGTWETYPFGRIVYGGRFPRWKREWTGTWIGSLSHDVEVYCRA